VVPGGGASGWDCTEPGGGTPCPGSGRFGVGSSRAPFLLAASLILAEVQRRLLVPLHVSEGGVLLYLSGPVARTLPRIFSAAEANGFAVTDLSVTEPTLEAVFITLTGKELRD